MRELFFFIGTEAELIKIFPVIQECQSRGQKTYIIASGQNDLTRSRILTCAGLSVELELSKEASIKKSAPGLLQWFGATYQKAYQKIRAHYPAVDWKNTDMIVHGDTVSTLMGAWIGKKLGMRVCHVEAGLRSHHLFNPFPEEIDRLLTSRCARLHFAPGQLQCDNLKKAKGTVVDTKYNTILDSLRFSMEIPFANQWIKDVNSQKYFVFVMHRQENLANKKFVAAVMDVIMQLSKEIPCMLILHAPTKVVLEEMGYLPRLEQMDSFKLLPRMDYFDFMKLLNSAAFVITDGGSNQEELHYMGKPCLIMRKATERQEGLGENAVMFDGKIDAIKQFAASYETYNRDPVAEEISPSKIIADQLVKGK